jgi:hypothetical protein
MESSSETNPSSIQVGYSTPPRSNIKPEPSFSFRQPKLLTSSELKRCFSPVYSSNKKRRFRKNDSLVPLERNLNMPVILQKLFDNHPEELSYNTDDCIVPLSTSSKILFRQPIVDCLKVKFEQENIFSIPETLMREKLKILLEKK